jgi:2-polyprenyl-6-methoxyphenol hydroxylase-like FAD-dependent oxidoreductase
VGVVAKVPEGDLHVRADLVIACDGRNSILREAAGLSPHNLGAPMDVLWFRMPRLSADPDGTYGIPGRSGILVLLNRTDYWQAAAVIPKGDAALWRARPIQDFRALVARRATFLRDRVDTIASWDDVKLLEVRVDRLPRWHRPGLLLIGDAAHAMSPIGGVGINLAIQDAVATANILVPALRERGLPSDSLLDAVQRRRLFPTKIIQGVQLLLQRGLIAPALAQPDDGTPVVLPGVVRFLLRSRLLRSIPARLFGVGIRREHVRTIPLPPATPAAPPANPH